MGESIKSQLEGAKHSSVWTHLSFLKNKQQTEETGAAGSKDLRGSRAMAFDGTHESGQSKPRPGPLSEHTSERERADWCDVSCAIAERSMGMVYGGLCEFESREKR